MEQDENTSRNFAAEINRANLLPNIVSSAIFFAYISYTSRIYTVIPTKEFWIMVGMFFFIDLILNIFVTPKVIKGFSKDISETLERVDDISPEERNYLVQDIHRCPMLMAMTTSFILLLTSVFPFLYISMNFNVSDVRTFYFCIAVIIGLYDVGIQSFCHTDILCSKRAADVVKKGVDFEIVHERRFYGFSFVTKVMFFAVVPLVLCNLLYLLYSWMSYCEKFRVSEIAGGFILTTMQNSIICVSLVMYIESGLSSQTKKLNGLLEDLNETEETYLYLPTDLSNELAYNIFMVDELIMKLQQLSSEAAFSGNELASTTMELSVAAKQSAEISRNEASGIHECLLTLENSRNQHEKISSHIEKIQNFAEKTKISSDIGAQLLSMSISKMSEIAKANLDTIYGIKTLTEKVDAVWKIISVIDSIAERTRTIAFNAELEASVAGENGEKFHIVANEIRRLAATITESTKEIKEKIRNIQHTADNLIITSEAGTQKTREGGEFFSNLEDMFRNLCISSDVTAESVRKIKSITDVQKNSFTQINDTLREITAGFEKFSESSQLMSEQSEDLKRVAGNLGSDIENNGEKS